MGSRPDLGTMVGPLHLLLFLLVQLCRAQGEDCSVFKKEYCNLRLDKILLLDTDIVGTVECQARVVAVCCSTSAPTLSHHARVV